MKILVLNPGSTSTKIAVFQGREALFVETIRHKATDLDRFAHVHGPGGIPAGNDRGGPCAP